jgi:low affinity Fe/Cu permease
VPYGEPAVSQGDAKMAGFIHAIRHALTQAIHAKLDELLSATTNARAELSQLDEEEPEEIERRRGEEKPGT